MSARLEPYQDLLHARVRMALRIIEAENKGSGGNKAHRHHAHRLPYTDALDFDGADIREGNTPHEDG